MFTTSFRDEHFIIVVCVRSQTTVERFQEFPTYTNFDPGINGNPIVIPWKLGCSAKKETLLSLETSQKAEVMIRQFIDVVDFIIRKQEMFGTHIRKFEQWSCI